MTTQLYFKRWQDVPTGENFWTWSNFAPHELACKGTGALLINRDALDALQRLRDVMAVPLHLTSAYRSPAHNARVGGAANSKHMMGIAFDIRNGPFLRELLLRAGRASGFRGFGLYRDFVHMDLGGARQWSG